MERLDDGFSTKITFSLNPAIKLYQRTVTPPGVDWGGPNDTTNMHNTEWRTRWPKKLKTLTSAPTTCAFDPAVLPEIIAIGGRVQQITYTFPDLDTWTIWGWIDKFVPGEHAEGDPPTAAVTIEPANQNTLKQEQGPVHAVGV